MSIVETTAGFYCTDCGQHQGLGAYSGHVCSAQLAHCGHPMTAPRECGQCLAEARAKVERLKAERDHAREALQDEVRLRGELQNRAEAAERKLKETRKELSTVKIQMWLIRLGRDWWILQASRAMSPERFKELQDVPADEKARAALGEGKGG